MLTLTRKVGETIRIGDDIEIVVKEIRKNQVRIGIMAPRDVKIYREEVYDNILAERLAKDTTPGSFEDEKIVRPGTGSHQRNPKLAPPEEDEAKKTADG